MTKKSTQKFCNFKAAKQSNLKTHQLTKHDKIRYNCTFCKFGDSQVSRVKLHEQRKHEISLNDATFLEDRKTIL